jgi:tRNA-2-methylthio-N6-dimethylallyladenosine synthase
VAVRRLERLQASQKRITADRLAGERGRVVEVLVEGASEDGGGRLGRTPENRLVHLSASEDEAPAGALVRARIVRAGGSSLSGEVVAPAPVA